MKNDISLQEYIKSLYPEQELTDYELNEMVDRLVQYFTLGAKVVYKHKKRAEKATLSENNCVLSPEYTT
jgi:hypothetical protein